MTNHSQVPLRWQAMAERSRPVALDHAYGNVLRLRKDDIVSAASESVAITQFGAAQISDSGWPGWPHQLVAAEPVIEMFVAGDTDVVATSDNVPFVEAWEPLATWMNTAVRTALADCDVYLDGDAFITASLTPTAMLEGLAHLDDAMFVPDDSVSVVAIIGQHAGPRIATAPAMHPELRPMASLTFDDNLLRSFEVDEIDHCAAAADELVVFPQFGQLHAGPAADHVAHLSPTRQLLVLRAVVSAN